MPTPRSTASARRWRPGDFIITPSWTWHDHGNDADEPVVWLDGLDIPMVRFLDAGFAENADAEQQTIARPEGHSLARYGANMVPVREASPHGATSPIFSYPYARSREALARLLRDAAIDAWDGLKLRYINPADRRLGDADDGAFLQLLPAGFDGKPYRADRRRAVQRGRRARGGRRRRRSRR